METNVKQRNPLPEVAICAAAFVVGLLLTKLMIFPGVLLPIIAAFVVSRNNTAWTISFYISAILLTFLIMPEHWWAVSAAVILASLPCGLAIRAKISAFDAVIISAAGWLVAIAGLTGYVYLAAGEDILTFCTKQAEEMINGSERMTFFTYFVARANEIASGSITIKQWNETTIEQMRKYLEAEKFVYTQLGYYIPTMMMGTVVGGGFLGYISVRALAKKRGTEVAYIPPFEKFYLPRRASKYFILMYILSVLPELFGWQNFYIAAYVLSSLCETVFLIQGISFVEFLLKKKIKRKGPRALLVTAISLTVSSLLVYVGLFGQFIRIRDAKLTIKNNPKNGGNNR